MSNIALSELIKELAKKPARSGGEAVSPGPEPGEASAHDGGTLDEVLREGWIEAVRKLIQQIRDWIVKIDDEKNVKFEDSEICLDEELIGRYSIPRLTIRVGPREVEVVPIAFHVLAPWGRPSEGRVDLTNGIEKYRLYRMEALSRRSGREQLPPWAIENEHGLEQFSGHNFARALKSLIE